MSNLYSVEIINKTYQPMPVQFRVNNPDAQLRFVQPLTETKPGELTKTMFFITLPQRAIHQDNTNLTIDILSGNTVIDQIETNFLGPNQ